VHVESGGCNTRQHDELDDEKGAHDDRPAAGCFCAASPIVSTAARTGPRAFYRRSHSKVTVLLPSELLVTRVDRALAFIPRQ
jgi:hypothetical protein